MEIDIRQSREYGLFMEAIGWKSIAVDNVQIFIRKIGPISIAKIQRVSLPLKWEKISEVLKKYKVVMCKIEPNDKTTLEEINELKKLGFRQDNWPLLGTKTMFVNLKNDEEKRLNDLGSDTRYKIRKLQKTNHKIKLNDHDEFYKIFKQAFAIKNIWMPPRKYYDSLVKAFGNKTFCMTIDESCGCLVLLNKHLASYFYGATLPEAKQNNLPYLLIWEAMKEAKKLGATKWDFEGIFDPRWPNKGWKGFSYFKERFAGDIVDFPGSFTRWSMKELLGF